MTKNKYKVINLYVENEELLKKVDKVAKENYMSRSKFTMLSWIAYLKFLEKREQ